MISRCQDLCEARLKREGDKMVCSIYDPDAHLCQGKGPCGDEESCKTAKYLFEHIPNIEDYSKKDLERWIKINSL